MEESLNCLIIFSTTNINSKKPPVMKFKWLFKILNGPLKDGERFLKF